MPKNTRNLIIFLTVFAALVVGVNFGRMMFPKSNPPVNNPVANPTPRVTPKPELLRYESFVCGITFQYPKTLTKLDIETGGAMLVDGKNPPNSVAVACQKDIPRPALAADKIENLTIGSASAKLYHDVSAKDGTPVDKLIFTQPAKKIDVYVSGYGENFTTVISSLNLK